MRIRMYTYTNACIHKYTLIEIYQTHIHVYNCTHTKQSQLQTSSTKDNNYTHIRISNIAKHANNKY